jgi:CheY-like chemotaxis protein
MTDGPFSGRRVLVIEDEMMVAMLLKDILADLGFTVVGSAARVEHALALIEAAGALDAAVLDINLNGQMSYPVADALVARGVPFLFATGYGRDSVMNGYRSFPLLQKPFRLLELAEALTKLLPPKEMTASHG